MVILTDWRKVISMPVIATVRKAWKLDVLEKILTESISRCVEVCLEKNDGKICTTLSGGLDSSFCLAKIRQIVGQEIPIHTFTIAGSERYPDYQFARSIADKFRTIHHDYIPSSEDITETERLVYTLWPDEPRSPGNAGVFLIYKYIGQNGFRCSIAHDGIDELLGGYWEHRQKQGPEEKAKMFENFWGLLEENHLLLLERKAKNFGVEVILPYLQEDLVKYVTAIPINDRTSFKESKIPLRNIARKYLPREIIERRKKGFCSALDKE